MSPRLAAALLLTLSGCPASRPTTYTLPPRLAPAVARFVVPVGRATRDGAASPVVFAADGRVTREGVALLRVSARSIVAPEGPALATLGEGGELAVPGASQRVRLTAAGVQRSDGVQVTRRDDGRLVLRNPEGEEATSPWTLECPAEAAPTAALVLLLVDGLDRAASPAQTPREPP
ncbi:MAG: hypothetical protein R3A48_15980 [Polyangiales bacterium]